MRNFGVLVVQLILRQNETFNTLDLIAQCLIECGDLIVGEFNFECFNLSLN